MSLIRFAMNNLPRVAVLSMLISLVWWPCTSFAMQESATPNVPGVSDSADVFIHTMDNLYRSSQYVLQVEIVEANAINAYAVCYTARVITSFKGPKTDRVHFTTFQRVTIGKEFLLAADMENGSASECNGAIHLRRASGEILWPIFRAGVLSDGDRWIALKGLDGPPLSGSPVLNGNDLCVVHSQMSGDLRACDIYGDIVRWELVAAALNRSKANLERTSLQAH